MFLKTVGIIARFSLLVLPVAAMSAVNCGDSGNGGTAGATGTAGSTGTAGTSARGGTTGTAGTGGGTLAPAASRRKIARSPWRQPPT